MIGEEGSAAAPMLRAVNAVADAIADEFPRVLVDTLAYRYTRAPPNATRPRANVVVRLCSIECNFAAPFTDASNAAWQRDLRGVSAGPLRPHGRPGRLRAVRPRPRQQRCGLRRRQLPGLRAGTVHGPDGGRRLPAL